MSYQAYLDNVENKTGKTANDFIRMARQKRLTEFKDIIAWLKKDYKLGLGHARAIAGIIRHGDTSGTLRLGGKKK